MKSWVNVCQEDKIAPNSGGCVKVGNEHIAIFNFTDKKQWYAVQNLCPHKRALVLSRGLIGDQEGEPKVACPLHKNTFSLESGLHLGGNEEYTLRTYEIKVETGNVYLLLEEK